MTTPCITSHVCTEENLNILLPCILQINLNADRCVLGLTILPMYVTCNQNEILDPGFVYIIQEISQHEEVD